MAKTSDAAVNGQAPIDRLISELVEKAGFASIRITVSEGQADAMRRVERWEEFSESESGNLELTGR